MPDETGIPALDQQFLDEVFEDVLARFEDGEAANASTWESKRPDLAAGIREMIDLARSLVGAEDTTQDGLPEVPGYRALSEIGRGGMGAVYLARQLALGGRLVALKVLPRGMALSQRARDRFASEAAAIGRLCHPNIVSIYDVMHTHGLHAFAMEWIEGASLQRIIDELLAVQRTTHLSGSGVRRGREDQSMQALRRVLASPDAQPPESTYPLFVCRIGMQVARALGVVHRAGLLHRDVKPSNILLRRDGTPLLTDFGLVRDEQVPSFTLTEQFVGTPAYASPEQVAGAGARDESGAAINTPTRVDARSDVYSLGVTLYHALSLRLPFKGGSLADIHRQIELGLAEPLRKANPSLPRDLETVVAKAMDAQPDRRYQTVDDLADDLERLLTLRPIRARPASAAYVARRFIFRNRLLVGLLSAVFLALLAGVIGTSIGLARALDARKLAERNAARARLNEYSASVLAAAAALKTEDPQSARARLDAAPPEHRGWEWTYLSSHTDESRLRLRWPQRPGLSGQPHVERSPPAGGPIAASIQGSHLLLSPEGRVLVERPETNSGWAVVRSPDGTRLAYPCSYSNKVVVRDAATLNVVWEFPTAGLETMCVAWSPDGTLLAVGAGNWQSRNPADRMLRIVDARSGALLREVPNLPSRVNRAVFLPDSRRVVCASSSISVVNALTGEQAPLDLHTSDPPSFIAVSDDAALLAAAGGDSVHLFDASTLADRGQVQTGPGISVIAFSPDSKLMYTAQRTMLIGWDLATRRRVISLRGHSRDIRDLSVSRDGATLITGGADGEHRFWSTTDPDELRTLNAHSEAAGDRDIRRIAYPVSDSDFTVIVQDLASGEILHRLGGDGARCHCIRFSPDGRYLTRRVKGQRLSLTDLQSESSVQIPVDQASAGSPAVFTPDGLYLITHIDGRLRWLRVPDLAEQRSMPLPGAVVGLDISSDGSRLIVATTQEPGRVFDAATLEPLARTADAALLEASFFSPDGRTVAAVELADDHYARLISAATGATLARVGPTPAGIEGLCFDPDGKRLFVALQEGSIRVLAIETPAGEPGPTLNEVLALRTGTFWLRQPQISPDGLRLFCPTVWPQTKCYLWSIGEPPHLIDTDAFAESLPPAPP